MRLMAFCGCEGSRRSRIRVLPSDELDVLVDRIYEAADRVATACTHWVLPPPIALFSLF